MYLSLSLSLSLSLHTYIYIHIRRCNTHCNTPSSTDEIRVEIFASPGLMGYPLDDRDDR